MSDSLYRNSLYLMANTATLGVCGLAFWTLAARMYPDATVGLISTLVTAATLVATFSYLGFDYALIRFLPSATDPRADANTGITISGVAAVVVALIYVAVARAGVPKLHFLASLGWWPLAFVALSLMTAWNYVTNVVCIASRRAQYALYTSLAFCGLRFVLLFGFNDDGRAGLLASWLAGTALCVFLSFVFLSAKLGYRYRPTVHVAGLRTMAHYAGLSYASSVIGSLPPLLLPTVIVALAAPSFAAYYYVVLTVITSLNLIPTAVTQALLAEGSTAAGLLPNQVKKAARVITFLVLPLVGLLVLFGRQLLSVFGPEYAKRGHGLLLMLCLTAIVKIASYLLSTILRIHRQVKPTAVVAAFGSVIALGGSCTALAAHAGLTGIGVAFLVAEFAVAGGYLVAVWRSHRDDVVAALPGWAGRQFRPLAPSSPT